MRPLICKFLTISIFMLLRPSIGRAQTCSCAANLSALEKNVEEDYSGFPDKVNAGNLELYKRFRDSLLTSAASSGGLSCYRLLQAYLHYFHDPHLNMFIRNADGYLDSLRMMFRDEPRVPFDLDQLKARWVKGTAAPLEGIWKFGSSYEIALIADPKIRGSYLGVVLNADSICWFRGQIKMRLTAGVGGKFNVTFYGRDHTPVTPTTVVRQNSIIVDGYGTWVKVFPQTMDKPATDSVGAEPVSFRILSGDASLLTIKSFDQEYVKETDSIIKANASAIGSSKILIIDLRGNGGGVSDCFFSLFPLIYTGPIPYDDLYLRSSPGNIAELEKWEKNPLPSEAKKGAIQDFIDSLKAEPGKMVLVRKGIMITLDSVSPNPKRIGILIDYGCASATEALLISCHYSSKVTLFGSRTHGGLDYSEILGNRSLPCPYWYYLCPAGKRGLKVYPAIDNIGIPPDVPLDASTPNWILYAKKYLERGEGK